MSERDAGSDRGSRERPFVRIQEAAKMTGVSAHNLRVWERRYGIPAPARGDNRYRRYSPADIEQINALAGLVAAGLTPSEAVADLRSGRADRERPASGEAGRQSPAGRRASTTLREEVVRALRELDEPALRDRLEEAVLLLPAETVVVEMIFPVIRSLSDSALGSEPEKVEAFLFSQVARYALSRMLGRGGHGGPLLWLACPEGELHDVALLAFAVLASRRGWSTRFFGPNTPLERLTTAAAGPQSRPCAVMLAVTRSLILKRNTARVRELAAVVPTAVAGPGAVRSFLDGTGAVFVGGSVTNAAARLDPDLGPAALEAAATAPPDRPDESVRGARQRT